VEIAGLKNGLSGKAIRAKLTTFLRGINDAAPPTVPAIARQTFVDSLAKHTDDDVVRLGRKPLLPLETQQAIGDLLRKYDRQNMGKPRFVCADISVSLSLSIFAAFTS
jgi:hypothetical protein